MRRLLVAALVAGSAAFVAPAPASAICWDTLYELTGYCNPCSVLGTPYGAVNRVAEKLTGDEILAPPNCVA